ncbi:MAG: LysR family transcriptional regulator [Pseudomonadota bacterium]
MQHRHLEQIVEICREGGFGRAARRLGVSQPSLSKSIARLEAELGVQLFERAGSGAKPTAYGRFLADRGEEIIGSVASLSREFASYVKGDERKLRIGVGPTTRLRPLVGVITEAEKAFPALRMEIRQGHPAWIIRGVAEGRFDIAFAYHGSAEPYGDLIRIKIFEDRYVLVCRPGHPMAANPPATVRELLAFPMAAAGMDMTFRGLLGPLSVPEQENLLAFQSDYYELIRMRAMGSDTVARGPRFIFEEDVRAGRLVELPYEAGVYECWMLTTPAQWRSPVVQAVAAFAKATAPANGAGTDRD